MLSSDEACFQSLFGRNHLSVQYKFWLNIESTVEWVPDASYKVCERFLSNKPKQMNGPEKEQIKEIRVRKKNSNWLISQQEPKVTATCSEFAYCLFGIDSPRYNFFFCFFFFCFLASFFLVNKKPCSTFLCLNKIEF